MKKFLTSLWEIIREELIFIIVLILLFFILKIPVNYYIVTGGGTSDVSSRITVEDPFPKKGSFNISYVTELKGTVFSYLLSFVMPHWERESANLYKYTTTESIEDIEFRSNLDLETANGTATYWAYHLAGKEYQEISSKIYVISKMEDYEINLNVGDEIKSINGIEKSTIEEYKEYLQTQKEKVTLQVIRKGKEIDVTTNLYEIDGKQMLGVVLQIVKSYETDPPVRIKFRSSESGPSGGLITTLEMYNQLTEEDITKGYKIAGTGTIELDGTIGQIGGVEHKILGAEDSNTDIFLVPSGDNYKEAKKYVKKENLKIKLIEVKNIEDAIEKLKKLKKK